MAFESGALDTTISAAAGNNPELFAELHGAFRDSVARQVGLLGRARCDGNWRVAAMRLKGLAATFHAEPLIELADAAIEAAPGEPTVVRALREYVKELTAA